MKRLSVLGAMLCGASVLLGARGVGAQAGGFALEQLEPAPAGDTFVAVPAPYAAGHLVPRGYAMFDYARRPIRVAGSGQAVVDAQGYLRAALSLSLLDRLLIDVELPFAVLQASGDATTPAAVFTTLQAPQVGDLRLGARTRLLGTTRGPIALGLGGYFYAPTGKAEQYAGDGGVRGAFHLPVGGSFALGPAALHWGAVAGATLRAGGRPHTVSYGAAAALGFFDDALQLGPELIGSTPVGDKLLLSATPAVPVEVSTNLELLGSVKGRLLGGLLLGAAAGPGLLSAVGTPTYRVLALAGWAPLPERPAPAPAVEQIGDSDGDGTPDDIDACPQQAGEPSTDPKMDGCPPPDRDGDGVLDVDDACPGTPGERSGDLTQNGCPVDSDGDGYHDGIDACPKVAGEASEQPGKLGCPPDRDEDGVADASDACPDASGKGSTDAQHNGCPVDPDGDGIQYQLDACPFEKGAPHADPKQNGCPEFVRVNKGEIVITQRIEFETYGDSLREAVSANSAKLLGEVRDVIEQHSEIELIEVQGHTDDSGDEAFNLELSQRRASTVRKWLVDHGVAPERLVAKGYGFSRPVADNRVRTGRQRNRRVQFVILRRRSK